VAEEQIRSRKFATDLSVEGIQGHQPDGWGNLGMRGAALRWEAGNASCLFGCYDPGVCWQQRLNRSLSGFRKGSVVAFFDPITEIGFTVAAHGMRLIALDKVSKTSSI
jgi:hypothetical protein